MNVPVVMPSSSPYDFAEGRVDRPVEIAEVAAGVGMTPDRASAHVGYFNQRRYFQTTVAGAVILNATGIDGAERIRSRTPSAGRLVCLTVDEHPSFCPQ